MSESKRDKTVYNAHKLRNDAIHCFPAGGIPMMSVLYGDLALLPGKEAKYDLVYPVRLDSQQPSVSAWFVARDQFPEFINCDQNAPPVPDNFEDDYQKIKLSTSTTTEKAVLEPGQPGRNPKDWARYLSLDAVDSLPEKTDAKRLSLSFQTLDEEGVYIIKVDTGEQPCEPYNGAPLKPYVDYVFIYCKQSTTFRDGDEKVGKQIADGVNLCCKNGRIWFVQPIFFVEQYLNIKLPKSVKKDMVYCEDIPKDFPACDKTVVSLICNRNLSGLKRICLHVDVDVDTCVEADAMKVQAENPIDLNELLKGQNT